MDSFFSGLGMNNQKTSTPKVESRRGPSVEDWITSPYSGPDQLARVEAYNASLMASPVCHFGGETPPGLASAWPPQGVPLRAPAGLSGGPTNMMFGTHWDVNGGRREGSGAVPSGAGMTDNVFRHVVNPTPAGSEEGGSPRVPAEGGEKSGNVDPKAVNRSHLTQKRYREKQKAKTADLVSKVEQYQAEAQALQEEKADLVGRNKMLMELLQERDKQIAELQAGREICTAHAALGAVTGNPGPQPDPHRPDPKGTSTSDGPQLSPSEGLAESLSVVITLTVGDEPISLTQDQMRTMSPSDLAKFWKEYVAKLALLLVAAENKSAPDHLLERVNELTEEALALMTSFSHPNPVSMKRFVSQKVEEDRGIFAREESHEAWLHTAASLCLTAEQQEEVKQLRNSYLANLDCALRQRGEAVKELAESGSSRVSLRKAAVTYLKTCNAQSVIRKLMEEEVLLLVVFVRKLFGQVLTPVQRARYMVQAYPWIPDHLVFATAVAAQGGDTEAKESLQMLHRDWSAAADSMGL